MLPPRLIVTFVVVLPKIYECLNVLVLEREYVEKLYVCDVSLIINGHYLIIIGFVPIVEVFVCHFSSSLLYANAGVWIAEFSC